MDKKNKKKKIKIVLSGKSYKMFILIGLALLIIGSVIYIRNCSNFITNITPINSHTGTINIEQHEALNTTSKDGVIEKKIINEDKSSIKKDNLSNETANYVIDFYNYINYEDYDELINASDKPFKNNNTIKTYFSEKRLNSFVNSIDSLLEVKKIVEIIEDRKDTDYITRKSYKYDLKYSIENIVFKENWKMVLVSRDGGESFLVNSLYCESKDCGKSPFYN